MKFATQSSGLLLEFCCGFVKLRSQLGSIGVHLLLVPIGASELSLLLLRVQPSITHRLLGALICTKHAVKPLLQWYQFMQMGGVDNKHLILLMNTTLTFLLL